MGDQTSRGISIEMPRLICDWRARQESNLYQELRKLSFYPLNYGRKGDIVACFVDAGANVDTQAAPRALNSHRAMPLEYAYSGQSGYNP